MRRRAHGARTPGPASDCGVFASASAPAGGDGSRASPFDTLQAALDRAAGTALPVFACGKEFVEHVHVPGGVVLYGALDCDAGWVWTSSKRTVLRPSGPAPGPAGARSPSLLDPGSGTVIEDVDVVAPDGAAPGVSSIAALANGTAAKITRCSFTAGNGANGAAGVDGSASPGDLAGLAGTAGVNVCATGLTSPGAPATTKTCVATGGQSVGGKGGDGGSPDGTTTPPGSGGDGAPASPGAGRGGTGEIASAVCTSGNQRRSRQRRRRRPRAPPRTTLDPSLPAASPAPRGTMVRTASPDRAAEVAAAPAVPWASAALASARAEDPAEPEAAEGSTAAAAPPAAGASHWSA